ncbi:EKC/KEOPS complex subunit Tprkb-like [Adelges cooleyi]|uniref:EKC/KEOPS complex subunit Tprkb-like n=1 Tax=Adelges cooleyi TaxID=133065 RepID=UPI00217F70B5|nr:EKC/KEOPS complex subunit Tprkb-like [Adelges cooleyi]
MKVYSLENGLYLGISHFTDVKNVKWLKDNISKYFKDRSPVLIRHSLIVDPFQIVVAANNACSSSKRSTMVTKTLATEILFNLSATKNITQSLRDCSAGDQDEEFFVAIVSDLCNVPEMKIFNEKCLDGKENDVSDIDETFIKSYYNINEEESNNCSILDSVVTRIACKSLM